MFGSNCIQESQPTRITRPIDHQIEGRTLSSELKVRKYECEKLALLLGFRTLEEFGCARSQGN